MRIALLGNFRPPYSTENDYARAWENNGHEVIRMQEGDPNELYDLMDHHFYDVDLVVWTRTEDLAAKNGEVLQWRLLAEARRRRVPIIGVHLDRWWGLGRERLIQTDPFFRVDLLFTADGGHDEQWQNAGVEHQWLLPGVSERWCHPGSPREQYTSDIAFVGGWQGGYHKEAQHRHDLVNWLDKTYGDRVKFWPKRGEHAVRGEALNDLYWSTKVVVGDSCLLPGDTNYCSDRIPETCGRGGYLLHPSVEGIIGPDQGAFWERNGFGCDYWTFGDWNELKYRIDAELEIPSLSLDEFRCQRILFIRDAHTYEKRVPQIIDICKERGLL